MPKPKTHEHPIYKTIQFCVFCTVDYNRNVL